MSQNPGGFQAILPVYQKLRKDPGLRTRTLFSDEAETIARGKNLRFVPAKLVTRKYVEKIFNAFCPDVVLCGTSRDVMSFDKIAFLLAKERRIPSIAVIDFWSNYTMRFSYAMRFSDPGTKNMRYLPDWILVMDTDAAAQMIKEGFSADRIKVTGNPHFDTLRRAKSTKVSSSQLISFIDQPFSEDRSHMRHDEIHAFSDIVEALERLGVRQRIVIKFHPRSLKKDKYAKIIAKSNLDITIDERTSTERLIEISSFVLGMNSMVLFDAVVAGKKVLSYQPGLREQDFLPTNKQGLSVGVYRKEDLTKKLEAMMQGKLPKQNKKIMSAYLDGHCTDRVIRFLRTLV